MFTDATTIRPRNGVSAECYWRIRRWCEMNGFSFSDVINSIMVPVAYYLENYCTIDKRRSMAVVEMNMGHVEILHVFNGKCYPLATETATDDKHAIPLEEIQKRIDHWQSLNSSTPQTYDLLLLNTNTHAKETLQKRKRSTA